MQRGYNNEDAVHEDQSNGNQTDSPKTHGTPPRFEMKKAAQ
jgi:hypothetical protein